MGLIGLFHWLGEDIDKLKTLRAMTKDQEQLKIIDEIIADLEKNNKED